VGWQYIEKIPFGQVDPANPKDHHENTPVEWSSYRWNSTGHEKGGKRERRIMIDFFRAFQIS
jgi:hypothetical protein